MAAALAEDIGGGDLTAALIPQDRRGTATVITREAAILCGTPYVEASFRQIDPRVSFAWRVAEGERAEAGQVLFSVTGAARTLLTGERTALNFLQLLSATATATHGYAKLLEGTTCRLLDTRKTIPGLRTAQKYAVRVGGGHNHRMGLFDGVLIKENHIAAAGSITLAVAAARHRAAAIPVEGEVQVQVKVEVEVENLVQLREAIDARADIVMLDNFSLQQMRDAVALNLKCTHPAKLEASGGISETTLREIAATGVDFISVGSITKHVRAIDLSMRFAWAR